MKVLMAQGFVVAQQELPGLAGPSFFARVLFVISAIATGYWCASQFTSVAGATDDECQ
jgi:hypothetical protein